MLKIVVFDSGFGGELFADYLEEELPIVEIIRVIDWRHANELQDDQHSARKVAEEALAPYIGKVDMIVFANYLLTVTSLRYFRKKYATQNFTGLNLYLEDSRGEASTVVLTTRALARTTKYHHYAHRIKAKTVVLNDWPLLIDDGELSHEKFCLDLLPSKLNYAPLKLILALGQLRELEPKLREFYGYNVKIIDHFDDTFREICHTLKIKGGIKKKK